MAEERCTTLKQILNSNNKKMNEMTYEMVAQIYQGERNKELIGFLGVDYEKHSGQ